MGPPCGNVSTVLVRFFNGNLSSTTSTSRCKCEPVNLYLQQGHSVKQLPRTHMNYQQQQQQQQLQQFQQQRAQAAAAQAQFQQQQQQQQQQQYYYQQALRQPSLSQPGIPTHHQHLHQYIDARLSTSNNNSGTVSGSVSGSVSTPSSNPNNITPIATIPSTSSSSPSSAKNNINNNNNTSTSNGTSYVGGILMNNGILNETDPKLISHMDLNELVQTSSSSNRSSTAAATANNNSSSSSGSGATTTTTTTTTTTSDPKIRVKSEFRNHSIAIPNNSNNNNNNTASPNNISNNTSPRVSSITNKNIENDLLNDKQSPSNNNTSSNNTSSNNTTATNKQSSNNTNTDASQDFKTDFSFREVSQQNKNIYNYAMNNNPHAINDPAIQESLSPYFQPFGVDVAHLPMTNPPIFQNSVPLFDEPVRRRRISISNGQISQLGEDIETVENLYNTQPPPMPTKYIPPTSPLQQQQQQKNNLLQPLPIGQPSDQQSWNNINQMRSSTSGTTTTNTNTANGGVPMAQAPQYITQQDNTHNNDDDLVSITNPDPNLMMQSTLPISLNQNQRNMYTTNNNNNNNNMDGGYLPGGGGSSSMTKGSISSASSSHSRVSLDDKEENTPGTAAWKRARLLERNRVAASKCRQRKKIAQLQLQKDFDNLSRENMIIKKKINYYEKLISKFKKFTQAHFQKCHSKNDDIKDLKMIEEMLMIDQDIFQVDENGTILKLNENNFL